jgi:hypothetical protein
MSQDVRLNSTKPAKERISNMKKTRQIFTFGEDNSAWYNM